MLDYLIKVIDGGRKEDKQLLEKFLRDLPSNGCVSYIRSLVGKTWNKDQLFSYLDTVWYEWDNVEHEFLDKEIEEKKKLFFQNARNYIDYVALKVFSIDHNLDYCGLAEEWLEHNPEEYKGALEKIPEKGRIVGQSYDEFVRFAKQKLNKPKLSWIFYTIAILLLPLMGSLMTILAQKFFD